MNEQHSIEIQKEIGKISESNYQNSKSLPVRNQPEPSFELISPIKEMKPIVAADIESQNENELA